MKRNNILLANQIRSKLTGEAVSTIVTETFMEALPFDKDVVDEAAGLRAYATNVVKNMQPDTLLDRAIENASSESAVDYLSGLKKDIATVVEAATEKEVHKAMLDETPTPEIVKQAKLDLNDAEKLMNAGQHNGIKAVAKLIQSKVLETIKDERKSYEEAEKIRNEIKDMVKSEKDDLRETLAPMDETSDFTQGPINKDPTPEHEDNPAKNADESVTDDQADPNVEADSTLESYFSTILAPTDPRNYVSLFSKLQDVCMENLQASTESYEGEIPFNTLEKITLESTFPFFDMKNASLEDEIRYLSAMEAIDYQGPQDSDEEKALKVKKTAKTAFICTICILTMLEVLKTMNLAKPSAQMVKDYVDTPTKVDDNSQAEIERIEQKVENHANDIKKSVAMGALTSLETAEAKESLTAIRERFQALRLPTSATESQSRILAKMDAALEMALSDMDREIRTDTVSVRLKEENIANLDRAIRVLSRRPACESIQLFVNSETPMGDDRSYVDVVAKAYEASGAELYETEFKFNTPSFLGNTVVEAVQECALYCDFLKSEKAKPVNFYFTNEKYSAPLVIAGEEQIGG